MKGFSGISTKVAELGATRPDNEDDLVTREEDVSQSLTNKLRRTVLSVPENRRAEKKRDFLDSLVPIEPSPKAISEELEPEYFTAVRIMQEDPALSPGEALKAAQEYLQKRKREPLAHGLTVGNELELGRPRAHPAESHAEYARMIDGLQNLGVMVDYDSLREVKFSKSRHAKDQLRAMYEMVRFGAIVEQQTIGIQINIGGFEDPIGLIPDLIVAHMMMSSTNDFGETRIGLGKDLRLPENSRKVLSQTLPHKIKTIPIRVRENGVVEFRGVYKKWPGYTSFARSFLRFMKVNEAIQAYAIERSSGIPEEEMSEEAISWVNARNKYFETATTAAINEDEVDKRLADLPDYLQELQTFLPLAREWTENQRFFQTELEAWDEYSGGNRRYMHDQDWYKEYEIKEAELEAEAVIRLRQTRTGREILTQRIQEQLTDYHYRIFFPDMSYEEVRRLPSSTKSSVVRNALFQINDKNVLAHISQTLRLDSYRNYADMMIEKANRFPSLWGAAVGSSKDPIFRKQVEQIIDGI